MRVWRVPSLTNQLSRSVSVRKMSGPISCSMAVLRFNAAVKRSSKSSSMPKIYRACVGMQRGLCRGDKNEKEWPKKNMAQMRSMGLVLSTGSSS